MITNKLNLPQPFVEAARNDHAYTPKRYSVTSVLKGTTEAVLQRRHAEEIVTDVADNVWAIFGSAVHSILERSTETPSQIKEGYLTYDHPSGYTLSGVFDLYDAETETVTDYKTASVWKAVKNDWDYYRRQLLLYCLILRHNGFKASHGQIVALLKDHSKSKARHDRTYPQHPVVVVSFDFAEEDFERAEHFLDVKFTEIEIAERMDDECLLPCSLRERWATPRKFAVMKKGRKSAVRLYDTQKEAEERAEKEGAGFYVELREREDRKCQDYCSVSKWCTYWQFKTLESQKKNAPDLLK